MKKTIKLNFLARVATLLLLSLLTTVTALATVTWDGGSGKTGDPYYVNMPKDIKTIDANGGSDVAPQLLYIGTAATAPTTPTLTGYEFDGWKLADADYDFATTVTEDITLTAAWTENVLELDNASNNTDIIAAAATGKTYNRVTLTGRTLYKDGDWNTLCLPFEVSTTDSPLAGDGVQAMVLNTTTSKLEGGTLTLNFDAATIIPAGTPFIIRWNNTGVNIENPVFEGVTVVGADLAPASFTGGEFVGSYSPVALTPNDDSNLFIGTNNTLFWPNAANNTDDKYYVNAFRAYFHVDPNANVRAFVLNFGDEESQGISDAPRLNDKGEMINDKEAGAWYDLQGRKLNGKPTKAGLYINKGHKVMVK